MALPSFLQKFFQKQSRLKNYLAFKVDKVYVSAAVWSIVEGKVQLGQVYSKAYKEHDFLATSDHVISQATAILAMHKELLPQEIIFGVEQDWVEDGKIKKEHLHELKHLCKEMALKPLGFVSFPESIENFLRITEGVPPTVILVGCGKEKVLVTLLRAGKIQGSIGLHTSEDMSLLVEKGIRHFDGDKVLPSRIILYDGESNLEKIKDKLISHPWTQKLPFLHFPKVEILDNDEIVKAIAVAGGIQMGGTFEEINEEPMEEVVSLEAVETDQVSEVVSVEVVPVDKSQDPALNVSVTDEIVVNEAEYEPVSEKDMEFDFIEKEPNIVVESKTVSEASKRSFSNLFSKFKLNFSWFHIPKSKFRPLLIVVPVVILALGTGLVVSYLYFFFKAQITIYISPKVITSSLELPVIVQRSNMEAPFLTGKIVTSSLTVSHKAPTTGKKTVGDKSKGQVTIFGVGNSKLFIAGSTLTSPEGLKFTLDADVKIASADASTPATAVVGITASQIGAKYNLASDTKFSIADNPISTYVAKNNAPLVGGSSKEINIVTKSDQDKLVELVAKELLGSGGDELRNNLQEGESLLDKAIASKIVKKKFSKDIGEEADSILVEVTMDFSGVVFDQKNANEVFKQTILSQIPPGYFLPLENITNSLIKINQNKANDFVLSLDFVGKVLPELQKEQLISDSIGRNIKSFSSKVKTLQGVSNVEVMFFPKQVNFIPIFPLNRKNIVIEIVEQ